MKEYKRMMREYQKKGTPRTRASTEMVYRHNSGEGSETARQARTTQGEFPSQGYSNLGGYHSEGLASLVTHFFVGILVNVHHVGEPTGVFWISSSMDYRQKCEVAFGSSSLGIWSTSTTVLLNVLLISLMMTDVFKECKRKAAETSTQSAQLRNTIDVRGLAYLILSHCSPSSTILQGLFLHSDFFKTKVRTTKTSKTCWKRMPCTNQISATCKECPSSQPRSFST